MERMKILYIIYKHIFSEVPEVSKKPRMSASDLITRYKYEKSCNLFTTKTASNQIAKNQINAIRCIESSDIYGNPYPKTWFDVPIHINEFPESKITSSQYGITPIMFSTAPLLSTRK